MEEMTREQALEMLRGGEKGVAEWNAYRATGATPPDLDGAELSDLNLRGVDLRGARLASANLSEADLYTADLCLAVLSKADLRGSNLGVTNLHKARLDGAFLNSANLSSANLVQASLDGADLGDSRSHRTVFSGDLSRTAGLNEIVHNGPSFVSHETLLALPDPFPDGFLRGCGVADELIEFARAHQGAVIFYSCFISYSHADEEFAQRLHADLQDTGVRCWFAPEDMKIGDRPMATINEAIRLRDKLVLILSRESIESDWVEHEVDRTLDEEKQRGADALFPIRLDEAVMECEFGWAKRIREAYKPSGRHIGNFTGWKDHDSYKAAFERLLRDLRQASAPTSTT